MSKDVLQANGIVPIDKGRKRAAPVKADPADEDGNESDTIQRIQALEVRTSLFSLSFFTAEDLPTQAELQALKQKRGRGSKRIKTEINTEVKRRPGLLAGGMEIIDLT